MGITGHHFLQTLACSLLKSPRRTCGSHCVVKHLPAEWAFSCLRGCRAFVSQKCVTCRKQSPTHTRLVINVLFYSKMSLGLEFRGWKFPSAWLQAGGIKFTWLPWQNPQQGSSAAHPCKLVHNFCPRGSGLIAWKGHKQRTVDCAQFTLSGSRLLPWNGSGRGTLGFVMRLYLQKKTWAKIIDDNAAQFLTSFLPGWFFTWKRQGL